MEKKQGILELLEKIIDVIKIQGDSSEKIFKSQVELIDKQVNIINRQIDIIEKQHEDNVIITQKLIEVAQNK